MIPDFSISNWTCSINPIIFLKAYRFFSISTKNGTISLILKHKSA